MTKDELIERLRAVLYFYASPTAYEDDLSGIFENKLVLKDTGRLARQALALTADDWQQIETAPLSGEIFLATNGEIITSLHWTGEEWYDFETYDPCGFEWRGATHWQPLPEPPKGEVQDA